MAIPMKAQRFCLTIPMHRNRVNQCIGCFKEIRFQGLGDQHGGFENLTGFC
ncbi:hypothetical protein D1872_331880 [compost metagenome]